MNRTRIQQLVRLMPETNIGLIPGFFPSTPQRLAQRLASSINDPAFGNTFVRTFVRLHLAMPPAVQEPYLRRAHAHYAGANTIDDMVMVEVEQLLYPENAFKKAVLEALLICKDATIPQVAEWVSLSTEVVQFYEQLHFNVRDRMTEKAYIAPLALPSGRLQQLMPDAMDHLSFARQLLQAGYMHGAQEVLVLAGLETGAALPSLEQSMQDLEKSIMMNASLLVRNGRQNSTKSPGINRAMQVYSARINAAPQTTGYDDFKHGLGSLGLSPGAAIKMTVDAIMADADPKLSTPELDDATVLRIIEAQRSKRT